MGSLSSKSPGSVPGLLLRKKCSGSEHFSAQGLGRCNHVGQRDHVWSMEEIARLIPEPVAKKRGSYKKNISN
jgi:hypothetical protein